MTQKDKDLLLKDLCGRLPYGVNVEYTFKITVIATNTDEIETRPLLLYSINTLDDMTVSGIDDDGDETICFLDEIKPYLFPLSTMTKEQKKEYAHILVMCSNLANCQLLDMTVEDWFRKNHFDYRGLIEKGLAIDATGLNIY